MSGRLPRAKPAAAKLRRVRPRTIIAGIVALALVAGAVLALTLTPSDSASPPPPERAASDEALASAVAIGSLDADAELDRRSEAIEDDEQLASGGPLAGLLQPQRRDDRIQALQWQAFDAQFRKTPFDKAIDKLAFRTPPLDVVQWVTEAPPDQLRTRAQRERFYRLPQRARDAAVAAYYRSGPHRLYARVDRKRFFAMPIKQRRAAVQAFYRDAQPWFDKAGIKDFMLIVSPWSPTLEELPEYAIGRNGSANLTSLGRGEKPGV